VPAPARTPSLFGPMIMGLFLPVIAISFCPILPRFLGFAGAAVS
jgi:hypothetical protein